MEIEQPTGAVRLNTNTIIDGRWYAAGEALPFAAPGDVPESLKPFIASAEAPPPEPFSRNIYDMHPAARRQARQLEMHAAHQEWAEAEASATLPDDLQAVLEDAHAARIDATLKQAEVNQRLHDDAYARLKGEEEAARPQHYVRRGGEWARTARAKLKPGEHVFVRRPNGQMESAGIVDSRGEPPPPEITT